MKRFIPVIVAAAALAIPSAASADVPRCEAAVATSTTVTTATFTVNQPRDAVSQFNTVWKHDYTVIVNADGTFAGTGVVTNGVDASTAWTESITGTFNAAKTRVSFDTVPNAGDEFHVSDAPMDNATVVTVDTLYPGLVEFKVGAPTFTTATTTAPGTESVKNHGQYVKALGGGKLPAQSCAGMPLNSTQGK